MDTIFLFDLDATITCVEILPLLAKAKGKYEQMSSMTTHAMQRGVHFAPNFIERVKMLSDLSVEDAIAIVNDVPMFPEFVDFIKEHVDSSYIVTGNLDVWIAPIIQKLGMENRSFNSIAEVSGGYVTGIEKLVSKDEAVHSLRTTNARVVAIGDGTNDIPMLHAADIAIAFGGAHPIPEAVNKAVHHCFDDAAALCEFLKSLAR